jgi:hypothetical protein
LRFVLLFVSLFCRSFFTQPKAQLVTATARSTVITVEPLSTLTERNCADKKNETTIKSPTVKSKLPNATTLRAATSPIKSLEQNVDDDSPVKQQAPTSAKRRHRIVLSSEDDADKTSDSEMKPTKRKITRRAKTSSESEETESSPEKSPTPEKKKKEIKTEKSATPEKSPTPEKIKKETRKEKPATKVVKVTKKTTSITVTKTEKRSTPITIFTYDPSTGDYDAIDEACWKSGEKCVSFLFDLIVIIYVLGFLIWRWPVHYEQLKTLRRGSFCCYYFILICFTVWK